MSQRRKYDAEFRAGTVTIVRETGKPIAGVAREFGVGAGTLGRGVHKDRLARGDDTSAERYPGRRTGSSVSWWSNWFVLVYREGRLDCCVSEGIVVAYRVITRRNKVGCARC